MPFDHLPFDHLPFGRMGGRATAWLPACVWKHETAAVSRDGLLAAGVQVAVGPDGRWCDGLGAWPGLLDAPRAAPAAVASGVLCRERPPVLDSQQLLEFRQHSETARTLSRRGGNMRSDAVTPCARVFPLCRRGSKLVESRSGLRMTSRVCGSGGRLLLAGGRRADRRDAHCGWVRESSQKANSCWEEPCSFRALTRPLRLRGAGESRAGPARRGPGRQKSAPGQRAGPPSDSPSRGGDRRHTRDLGDGVLTWLF